MVLNAMAGDPLPVYGDGMQVRNWLFTEDFASAIDVVLERGEAGEVYNVGGPEELPNIEVVQRILELTGRDESLIDLRRRPPRPRPPLLALGRAHRGPRLEGRRSASTRGSSARSSWYRDNEEWWGPIRSGEYREYYERQYGRKLGG